MTRVSVECFRRVTYFCCVGFLPVAIETLLRRTQAARTLRARSLVITVFGDTVAPHGGRVWIGSLIRWLDLFGVNERNVRTAVQRLVRDGWLTNRSAGRKSDYALTETSRHRFEDAERRIYASEPPSWNGHWCLVLLGPSDLSTRERDAVRRELRWHGFGEFTPTVLLHPSANLKELALDLVELGVERKAVVLSAEGETGFPGNTPEALRHLTTTAWDLTDLAADYRAFVRRFRPIATRLASEAAPPAETCFRIRILLIHEYRRILLRDPRLPEELLPENWIGSEARWLCEAIYRRVESAATAYVLETGETSQGPLPAPGPVYFERFGGLAKARRPARGAFG